MDTWDSSLFGEKTIFKPFHNILKHFKNFNTWPTIDEYNHINNMPDLECIHQLKRPSSFEDYYDPMILKKNKLLTRLSNWHDFFNFTTWVKYYQIKKAINSVQYKYQHFRHVNQQQKRTVQENTLTQFDECGMIVICNNDELIYLLQNFKFKEFFTHKKLFEHVVFLTFGHATLECYLSPYIGLTAKAIICKTKKELTDNKENILNDIFTKLSNKIRNEEILFSNDFLQPIPILGIPGWHENQDENFYNNKSYFRNKPENYKNEVILV